MAAARGCSLSFSTLAARRRTSSSGAEASFGLPSVSVPVLSTTKRIYFCQAFERFGISDEDTSGCAAAGSNHDRHRRGEAQCARARDDEDRNGIDQCVGQARLRAENRPDDERHNRDREDCGHKDSRDSIGQPLDGRTRALRFARPFARCARA